jgi:hypothetical protein
MAPLSFLFEVSNMTAHSKTSGLFATRFKAIVAAALQAMSFRPQWTCMHSHVITQLLVDLSVKSAEFFLHISLRSCSLDF